MDLARVLEEDEDAAKAPPPEAPLHVLDVVEREVQTSAFAHQLLAAIDEPPPRTRAKKRWTRETGTYGEWVRTQPPEALTDSELAKLNEERRWEEANPEVVAALDALVGFAVVLRKSMRSLYDEADDNEGRHGRVVYPQGMKLMVVARLGKNFLAQTDMGFYLLVLPRWVKPMPLPTAKKADEDADAGT